MQEAKTYSVKEAANLLGLSEITIRRKIKENTLDAELPSKKEGYQITEESLKKFAETCDSRVNALWSKGVAAGAALGVMATTGSAATLATGAGAAAGGALAASILAGTMMIGGPIGLALGKILGKTSSMTDATTNSSEQDAEASWKPDNPVVIDKVIDRLKAEMEDFDIRIDYQSLKMKQAETDEAKMAEQEKLLELKLQKNKINKDIKDLEIRKSLLQENAENNASLGSQIPKDSSGDVG